MLYTSYYSKIKKIKEQVEDPFFISVSRGVPKFFKGAVADDELLPSWELIRMAKNGNTEEYIKQYKKQLKNIDCKDLLLKFNTKKNIVLLCYEKAQDGEVDYDTFIGKNGKFCHRHMIAQWIRDNGADIFEFSEKHALGLTTNKIFIDEIDYLDNNK